MNVSGKRDAGGAMRGGNRGKVRHLLFKHRVELNPGYRREGFNVGNWEGGGLGGGKGGGGYASGGGDDDSGDGKAHRSYNLVKKMGGGHWYCREERRLVHSCRADSETKIV